MSAVSGEPPFVQDLNDDRVQALTGFAAGGSDVDRSVGVVLGEDLGRQAAAPVVHAGEQDRGLGHGWRSWRTTGR